jgi:hypothetical protein
LLVVVVVIIMQRIECLPSEKVNRAQRITAIHRASTMFRSIAHNGVPIHIGGRGRAIVMLLSELFDVHTRAAEPHTLFEMAPMLLTCSCLLLVELLQMRLLLGLQNTHFKLYPPVIVGRGLHWQGFAESE